MRKYDPTLESPEMILRGFGTEVALATHSKQELTDEFLDQLPKLYERLGKAFDDLTRALARRTSARVRKTTYTDWSMVAFTQNGPVTIKISARTHRKVEKFDRMVGNIVGLAIEQEVDSILTHERDAIVEAEAYAREHPELPLPLLLDVNRLAKGNTVEFFEGDPAFDTTENVLALVSGAERIDAVLDKGRYALDQRDLPVQLEVMTAAGMLVMDDTDIGVDLRQIASA